jgi:hypothetical protein
VVSEQYNATVKEEMERFEEIKRDRVSANAGSNQKLFGDLIEATKTE